MGMFDTIFAALVCPFCGRCYHHAPLSLEQAVQEIKEYKQRQIETRQEYLQDGVKFLYLQDLWAKQDGFDNVEAWIDQLDTPARVEAYRTRPFLGLAEIQTKEFDNVLAEYYVGDEVPKYSGHYFIPASFKCAGCSTPGENVYVSVWLEIGERKLKAVLTHDPETNEPARQIIQHAQLKPHPPHPHPPLHFKHRGVQAHAIYNPETSKYDLEVHHLPERFCFSHQNEELLRELFQSFAEGYLYLLGEGMDEVPSLHEHLQSVCRHLPSDFEPYGERERTGPDCSSGCRHFLKLPGKLGMDWGVCTHSASPRMGLLTFEHQGCEQFEK